MFRRRSKKEYRQAEQFSAANAEQTVQNAEEPAPKVSAALVPPEVFESPENQSQIQSKEEAIEWLMGIMPPVATFVVDRKEIVNEFSEKYDLAQLLFVDRFHHEPSVQILALIVLKEWLTYMDVPDMFEFEELNGGSYVSVGGGATPNPSPGQGWEVAMTSEALNDLIQTAMGTAANITSGSISVGIHMAHGHDDDDDDEDESPPAKSKQVKPSNHAVPPADPKWLQAVECNPPYYPEPKSQKIRDWAKEQDYTWDTEFRIYMDSKNQWFAIPTELESELEAGEVEPKSNDT
jgi:hypothetical protein